ncbi:MAG: lyase family protein [Pseudomonadota bacterium]
MSLAPGTPWTRELLGDAQIEALFGEAAQVALLKRVEVAFLEAQAEVGVLDAGRVAEAVAAVEAAGLDPAALVDGTSVDGVVVPALVRALRGGRDIVHTGLTSQDVIDAAAVLTARAVDRVLAVRLSEVVARIDDLASRFGDREMGGRTRMQWAGPLPVAERLRSWGGPVVRGGARRGR